MRLRLRLQTDSGTGRQLRKLNKKVDTDSPYIQTMSRILPSELEYDILDRIEGDRLSKTRHYDDYRGRVFSIDVFDGELEGLVLCEAEADSLDELLSIEPPEYVEQEVTEHPFFKGGSLCRATRAEVAKELSRFGRAARSAPLGKTIA